MSVELVQKVHHRVRLKCCAANDDMLFSLSPMNAITSSELLLFHPSVRKLFELSRQDNQRHTDHYDHEQLRWPSIRFIVTVTNGCKSDDNKVQAFKQINVLSSSSLEMLITTDTMNNSTGGVSIVVKDSI